MSARPITDTLRHIGGGVFIDIASDKLAELVAAVAATGKSGSIDLKNLTEQMRTGIQRGLRLYYNGRQFGLFPRCPTSGGWIAFVNGQRHP